MLWHAWTLLHLRWAVQDPALSTSFGSVLWAGSSGTAPGERRARSSARVAAARHGGEPCGVRGEPGVPGEGMAGSSSRGWKVQPPAKYHSRQRPPGSGVGGAAVGSRCRPEEPRLRGRARPRWRRRPRPLVLAAGPAALSAATPALRPAPSSRVPPSLLRPALPLAPLLPKGQWRRDAESRAGTGAPGPLRPSPVSSPRPLTGLWSGRRGMPAASR